MMKSKFFALLFAASVLGCGLASAGTEQTVTFTAVVPSVLELTTSTNAAGVTITSGDYTTSSDISIEAAAAHELSVRANRAWLITAKSGAATFSFTPAQVGETRSKPASDLEVRKANGTYQALSTTGVNLASGSAGSPTDSGNTFSVDYKFLSNITVDPAGTYTLDTIYTLTAP